MREELGSEAELYFILGMDSVRELRRWRDPERLFDMCTVVAVSRPDSHDISPTEIEREFPAARGRIKAVRGPMLDVSATDIRTRIAEGRSISDSVPTTRRAIHPRTRPLPGRRRLPLRLGFLSSLSFPEDSGQQADNGPLSLRERVGVRVKTPCVINTVISS